MTSVRVESFAKNTLHKPSDVKNIPTGRSEPCRIQIYLTHKFATLEPWYGPSTIYYSHGCASVLKKTEVYVGFRLPYNYALFGSKTSSFTWSKPAVKLQNACDGNVIKNVVVVSGNTATNISYCSDCNYPRYPSAGNADKAIQI